MTGGQTDPEQYRIGPCDRPDDLTLIPATWEPYTLESWVYDPVDDLFKRLPDKPCQASWSRVGFEIPGVRTGDMVGGVCVDRVVDPDNADWWQVLPAHNTREIQCSA